MLTRLGFFRVTSTPLCAASPFRGWRATPGHDVPAPTHLRAHAWGQRLVDHAPLPPSLNTLPMFMMEHLHVLDISC